jgi:hypothetical protein
VDRSFLASSRVDTPDPRQNNPPKGERLLIAWNLPHDTTLDVNVRFWNEQEKRVQVPLENKRGSTALWFPHQEILTYRVDAVSWNGEIISTWEHQFWTRWIEIGKE